ncbi:MAG: FAD-dependent monooxygenase [Alphaproteobacteria bacterium]|nr:FAD-dependent monooxygenase [Alphaproteobacteria bacterium]
MPEPFHVLIIGGGIGGLTLAQGLKRAGVSTAIYERDRTLTDRLQGYRVHISPTGSLALHECLPPHLFEVFDRTCGAPTSVVRFFTEQMRLLLAFDGDLVATTDPVARHRSASRITLRQVLLADLDNLHFGKTFQCYQEHGGRTTAYFEDGTSVEGDVLVAADGGGSRVRRQFLPDAQRVDTGVVGIAGKIFLDTARDRIARPLLEGISLVAARGGFGLFVAVQEMTGGVISGIGGNEPALAGTGNLYENMRSYLMWALSAKRQKFGLVDVEQADSAALVAAAARIMAGWSRGFRDLVGLADPTTISCLPIRTSVPIAPWRTGRITLLGDAIHSMTPYRGIGANVAIKDAARLKRALVAAHRGERDLVEAIGDYEAGMLGYGFRAVRNSLKAMHQTVTDSVSALMFSRLTLRAINALPPVKRMMAKRLGEEWIITPTVAPAAPLNCRRFPWRAAPPAGC